MNFLVNVIIIVLMIGILVFVHELGHFIVAKLAGMYVEEFALGMGPLVFAKKYGETQYSLRLFPVGGFVQILGEEEVDKDDGNVCDDSSSDDDVGKDDVISKKELKVLKTHKELMKKFANRSFRNKSALARMVVMLAGVTANFILASLLYYGLLWSTDFSWSLDATLEDFNPWFGDVSVTKISDVLYSETIKGAGAMSSGMPNEGIIKSVDGKSLEYSTDLSKVLADYKGEVVTLDVCGVAEADEVKNDAAGADTSGESASVVETMDTNSDDVEIGGANNHSDTNDLLEQKYTDCSKYNVPVSADGLIGVMLPVNYQMKVSYNGVTKYLSGFVHSANQIQVIITYIPKFLGDAIRQGEYKVAAASSMTSPIGMYFMIDKIKAYGVGPLIETMAGLSLSLFLINLVPIPALDGGRAVLLLPEVILRRPLNGHFEEMLVKWSFYALLLLMVLVVLKDIVLIDVFRDMF